jgi:hypothetical protein
VDQKKVKAGATPATGLQGVVLRHQEGCHTQDPKRKHDFIIGSYRQDDVGEWFVDLPVRGPCADRAKNACKIKLKLQRERKTGPRHPLFVVKCETHGRFFTIYPPGFGPYVRKRLPCQQVDAQAAPALRAVRDAADEQVPRWLDWRDPEGKEPCWRSTQWRQIARWGRWLGLVGPEGNGQQIAAALGVPLHEHAAARAMYQKRLHYRQRAVALLSVLRLVSLAGDVMRKLLRAGAIAGLMGRGFGVDRLGRLRPLVPV